MCRFNGLIGLGAPAIRTRAEQVSSVLRGLGIPRATEAVYFLVGSEAFETTEPFLVYREELKELASGIPRSWTAPVNTSRNNP